MLGSVSRRILWLSIVFALALHAPSLGVGFLADDHAQRLALAEPERNIGGLSFLDLYDFGSAASPGSFRELPWWTSGDWSVRFLRPLSSAVRSLELWLFGASAWPQQLLSLLYLALLLALLARLYARLGLTPRAQALALALFAADESSVVPVAWLANRNSLLEAIFAAGACLCASARPARPAWALLLALSATLCKESGLVFLLAVPCLLPRAQRGRALFAGALLAGLYLTLYLALGRGASSRFYPEPWSQPLATLARAPRLLLESAAALWTPYPPDLGFQRPELSAPLLLLAAALALAAGLFVWTRRAAMPRHAGLLSALALATLAPQIAAPPSNRLLLLPAAALAPLLAAWLTGGPATVGTRLALFLALPLSAASTAAQGLLLANFARESRAFAERTAALARAAGADQVLLLGVPNPLAGLVPSAELALERPAGPRANVLQLGARPLTLIGLEGGGLAILSRGQPFGSSPMEQVFRSPGARFAAGATIHRGDQRWTLSELAPGTGDPGVVRLELALDGPRPLLIAHGSAGAEPVPWPVPWPAPGQRLELPAGPVPWPFGP
jgi:hypothetical protein